MRRASVIALSMTTAAGLLAGCAGQWPAATASTAAAGASGGSYQRAAFGDGWTIRPVWTSRNGASSRQSAQTRTLTGMCN